MQGFDKLVAQNGWVIASEAEDSDTGARTDATTVTIQGGRMKKRKLDVPEGSAKRRRPKSKLTVDVSDEEDAAVAPAKPKKTPAKSKAKATASDKGKGRAVDNEPQASTTSGTSGSNDVNYAIVLSQLINDTALNLNDAVLDADLSSSPSEMVNTARLRCLWAYFEKNPSVPGPMSTLTVALLRQLRAMVVETTLSR